MIRETFPDDEKLAKASMAVNALLAGYLFSVPLSLLIDTVAPASA